MLPLHARLTVACCLVLATGSIAASTAGVQRFDVAAQPASSGVRAFAQQASIQVIVAADVVAGRRTNAVHGTLSVREGLQHLLGGTGLAVRSFDGRLALLGPAASVASVPTPTRLDTVQVTGTRLPRNGAASTMPLSVTRMDQALALGQSSAYEALAQEPSMGIGHNLSSASNGWDAGIAAVNLRNLGPHRSLTLVDGQRRVSSSARTSAVDVGMVPVAMIERIEVVTGGAAAIHGADAVTGAVNIVTRRDIDHTSLSASSGQSARGDAREHQLSAATGGALAGGRGRFTLGGTYSTVQPLQYRDRFNWRDYPYHVANPANTGIDDGIPDRLRIDHFRQIYFDYQPTYYLQEQEWIVDAGMPRPATYQAAYSGGPFSLGDGGDGRNLMDDKSLRGGLDSLAVMGHLDLQLGDSLRYEAYFSHARQQYAAAGDLYRDDSRSAYFSGAGGSFATLDNPYVPAAVRQAMLDNGLQRLDIARTFGNFPARQYLHDRRTLTMGHVLTGDAGGFLRWKTHWQYGRASDHAVERNIAVKSHWTAARDVIADPGTGLPICRDPQARAQGCVPLDIFSQATPSPELLGYVMADRHEKRVNHQHILGAQLEGSIAALPAGELAVVAGSEYRHESLRTRDDPRALAGELQYDMGPSAHPELDVSFGVLELFGEVRVPLLDDNSPAGRIDANLAWRHSHYSTVGPTNAWNAGLSWSPRPWLGLRVMRSRSVRPPNFGELYEPQVSVQRGSIDDPCEAGAYHASHARARNCAALGVATPLPDVKVGPITSTEGNPDLQPERSDVLTLGLLARPTAVPGLELSVDYWDIDIRDVITQLDYSTLLALCVDLPGINNPYCALSERDAPLGNPVSVTSRQVNAPRLRARGIDFGLGWQHALWRGELSMSLKGTRLLEQVTDAAPGIAKGRVVADGSWLAPHCRATLRGDYALGRFNLAWQMRWRGPGRYDVNVDSAESYPDNRVPSSTYHDISVRYRLANDSVVGLGVRNLFDAQRPDLPGLYENYTVYDLVGRYLHASLDLRF